MESHLNFKFRFKIEPKPEGGFVARAEESDISVEGATKEEVEQKILDKLGDVAGPQVSAALKGLSLADLKKNEGGIHVEKKFKVIINDKVIAGGSKEPGVPAEVAGATHEESGISRQLVLAIALLLALLLLWFAIRR